MAVPRTYYGPFIGLRFIFLFDFIFLLLASGDIINEYLGMHILSRTLQQNPRNFSQDKIDEIKRNSDITVREEGPFFLGCLSVICFIILIYGLVGMLAREMFVLIIPLVMFPFVTFYILTLLILDLNNIYNPSYSALQWIVFTAIIVVVTSIHSSCVVRRTLTKSPSNVTSSTNGLSFPKKLSSGDSPKPKS